MRADDYPPAGFISPAVFVFRLRRLIMATLTPYFSKRALNVKMLAGEYGRWGYQTACLPERAA